MFYHSGRVLLTVGGVLDLAVEQVRDEECSQCEFVPGVDEWVVVCQIQVAVAI